MSDEKTFVGKTAMITGAGRGIGLCIAAAFLRAGGNVVLAEADEKLQEPALKRLDAGKRAVFAQTDVSSETAVAQAIALTVERFGRLDAVIHNAAIADNRPAEDLSYESWKKVLDTNLSAAFLCAKHAAPHLRTTAGAIVLIASTRALMSEPNTEAYAASKGGLLALTHALAMSLAPVRVNSISPGWIVTDHWRCDSQTTTLTPQDHAQHPVARIGRPEDIADMALYLCSEKAGFITGQNIVIDGGMTKKMSYHSL
jgi:NAD(P)-dependent dehydrogenase (short-subunit alcohol dehydrogenase family)